MKRKLFVVLPLVILFTFGGLALARSVPSESDGTIASLATTVSPAGGIAAAQYRRRRHGRRHARRARRRRARRMMRRRG